MKNVKNKLSKKLIASYAMIISASSLIAITPGLITISEKYSSSNKNNGSKYNINGNQFSSYEDAKKYVLNNSTIKNYDEEKWVLKYGDQSKSFDNPNDLRQYVFNKYIKSSNFETSLDIDSKIDLGTRKINLTDDDWSKLSPIANSNQKNNSQIIFKKQFDNYSTNEDDAYKSYFQTKDAYYFNGMYFSTKELLNTYLLNVYLPSSNNVPSFNTFTIVSPDGVVSNPIRLSNDIENINYLLNFIKLNAKKVLSYTNSSTNKKYTISSDNYKSLLNEMSTKDMSYQSVYSNQGESRYIVDNYNWDAGNLIGPYVYSGSLDIASFQNINMWKKSHSINKSVYIESKVQSTIGNFFSRIINDNPTLTIYETENMQSGVHPQLFRTPLFAYGTNKELDQEFMRLIKLLSPTLYDELVEVNSNLMQGKKYNPFFKIPVLYSFLLDRIINLGLGNDGIELVFSYFSQVADYIQDMIEGALLYDQSLLIGVDGSKFNLRTFFEIGNPEYDFNTNPYAFYTKIVKTYPKLVSAIITYNGAYSNIFLASGLLPFTKYDFKFIIDEGIINQQDYADILPNLEKIYNTWSQTTKDLAMKDFIKNNSNSQIKAIESQSVESEWEGMLNKIILGNTSSSAFYVFNTLYSGNTQYHSIVNETLKSEIEVYNTTGHINKSGYLFKIYSTDSSKDRLGKFLLYARDNPNADLFRVYMAILTDIKLNLNLTLNSNIYNDNYLLGRTIGSLVMSIIGLDITSRELINTFWSRKSKRSIDTKNNINFELPNFQDHYLIKNTLEANNGELNSKNGLVGKRIKGTNTHSMFAVDKDDFVEFDLRNEIISKYGIENWNESLSNQYDQMKKIQNKAQDDANKNGNFMFVMSRDETMDLLGTKYDEYISTWDNNDSTDNVKITDSFKIDVNNKGFFPDEYNTLVKMSSNGSTRTDGESGGAVGGSGFELMRANLLQCLAEQGIFPDNSPGGTTPGVGNGVRTVTIFGDPSNRAAVLNNMKHDMLDVANVASGGLVYPKSEKKYKMSIVVTQAQVHAPESGIEQDNVSVNTWDTSISSEDMSSLEHEINQDNNVSNPGDNGGPINPDGSSGNGNGSDGNGGTTNPGGGSDGNGGTTNPGGGSDGNGNGSGGNGGTTNPGGGSGGNGNGSGGNGGTTNPGGGSGGNGGTTNPGGGSGSIPSDGPEAGTKPTKSQRAKNYLRSMGWHFSTGMKSFGKFVLRNVGTIFGFSFVGVEIAFLIYDIFREQYSREFYTYVAIDGTEFIWDGGMSVSKYMGLVNDTITSLTPDLLLKPVRITTPNYQTYYYFNATKYYDKSELKHDFVKRMLDDNLDTSSKNFQVGYTFDRLNSNNNYNMVHTSVGSLLKYVLDTLGIKTTIKPDQSIDYNFDAFDKTSPFISTVDFAFSNGMTTSGNNTDIVIAQNIVDNIRATKVTKLPKVNSYGEVLDIDDTFVYPGLVWTPSVIKDNSDQYGNYIIDNSANKLKENIVIPPGTLIEPSNYLEPDKKIAEQNSKNAIFNQFKTKFKLNNKVVLKNDLTWSNKYSSLKTTFNTKTIYFVSINQNENIPFATSFDAENYVVKNMNYEKIVSKNARKIYFFGNHVFNSIYEIDKYIESKLEK